jgi:transcriptional regulator with XRE-family HTH domain
MDFQHELAKIFREAREAPGLTQLELAKKAKMSVNYYAQIEQAKVEPRANIINKVVRALGIELKLPIGD